MDRNKETGDKIIPFIFWSRLTGWSLLISITRTNCGIGSFHGSKGIRGELLTGWYIELFSFYITQYFCLGREKKCCRFAPPTVPLPPIYLSFPGLRFIEEEFLPLDETRDDDNFESNRESFSRKRRPSFSRGMKWSEKRHLERIERKIGWTASRGGSSTLPRVW